MLYLILPAFVLAVLFNFFILMFGKKDLEDLKKKMSIGRYLEEINESLVDTIGDRETTIIKVILTLMLLAFLAFHFISTCLIVLAVILGSGFAKRAYRVGFVSDALNRLATYINRLR